MMNLETLVRQTRIARSNREQEAMRQRQMQEAKAHAGMIERFTDHLREELPVFWASLTPRTASITYSMAIGNAVLLIEPSSEIRISVWRRSDAWQIQRGRREILIPFTDVNIEEQVILAVGELAEY
ncbi:MAG: hypothetical protein EOM24_14495 [Chloroflexia bacterium]|nr:hypothetical protein [Chloroflexia bacterium]